MRKSVKRLLICAMIPAIIWGSRLIRDKQQLQQELIRLHVVANSDSPQDQAVKLKVRDAVLDSIRQDLRQITDVEAAKSYLRENLPKIQKAANQTLEAAGFTDTASISLCEENFDKRIYDTFTLPAGIYQTLRVVIGSGQGHNWWCVAFPELCLPAASDGFEDAAAGAGFSGELTKTLSNQEDYEVRFYLLDALGRLENILRPLHSHPVFWTDNVI